MGRPRRHDLDDLLGHARNLWIERGADGLTIRALSSASGASNGAVYHAFRSRAGLLAGVWAQEAGRFLVFQRERVREAMLDGEATSALVAAALAPATYATDNADGARLLLAVTADDLLGADPGEPARTQLIDLQKELGTLLVDLASALWDRRDRAAVEVVRHCVVTLPGALLLQAESIADPLAAHSLEHAVRGIATAVPPASGV
ncbi:TetR/AcrR family transcriptional regulator [Nocardioides panzhihuensis]|uniref:AcrR family transcriptional regulator n=1 Tax=Nocardioides panzhihuensis TaxID=860243 RepID=A0A7Z0IUU6_9ACTN|nr:TetR/AcrR family transcriptional regulator [Nocardioides panzhihuensis]NYI80163.1 AcrR family transcriptional regulator [Nocardioides panzhihuensis]